MRAFCPDAGAIRRTGGRFGLVGGGHATGDRRTVPIHGAEIRAHGP